jgi:hypothetical protein
VQGMAEGYFHTFFKEEMRLGMGAGGSVFLCQVCDLFTSLMPWLIKCSAHAKRKPFG